MRNHAKPLAILGAPIAALALIGIVATLLGASVVAAITMILLLSLTAAYAAGALIQSRAYQRSLHRELKALQRGQRNQRDLEKENTASLRGDIDAMRSAIGGQEFRLRQHVDNHFFDLSARIEARQNDLENGK